MKEKQGPSSTKPCVLCGNDLPTPADEHGHVSAPLCQSCWLDTARPCPNCSEGWLYSKSDGWSRCLYCDGDGVLSNDRIYALANPINQSLANLDLTQLTAVP